MGDSITFLQPQYAVPLAAAGMATLDDFLADQAGIPVSAHGMTHTRRIVFSHDGQPLAGYLKTYDYARRPWRHRFIRDKARREAENFAALRHACGMTVPTVVCLGARRRLGALVRSFILTLELSASRPLTEKWDRSPSNRIELLTRSPGFVARMHAAGFVHIDLRWRNILVSGAPGASLELVPIDCVRGGLRRWRTAAEQGRLRDLSSLYKDAAPRLSRTQRMRWYRAYVASLEGFAAVTRVTGLHRQAIRVILRDRDSKDGSLS